MAPELVLQQVCVVRGGDEVVAQGQRHVLVDALVLWVEDRALGRAQVHQEAVNRHGLEVLSCECEILIL